jgi:hypothetical protein
MIAGENADRYWFDERRRARREDGAKLSSQFF